MSYVPGCSVDVFLSYAHADNHDGWVAKLKAKLTEKLNPFLAARAEVWFDDRIQPGVYFREKIQQLLQNTPVFVAVISTSYLESDFCMLDELDWFQNQGGKDIFQLVKTPLEEGQEVPVPEAKYNLMYDESDGRSLTGKALDKALDKIVAAMTKKLREFWEDRPKIYVAQLINEDLKRRWDEMKKAFHAEGYAILPKGVLPPRVPEGLIRKWLEAARLSVHLGGVRDDPLAQRQWEIARQIGKPAIILSDAPAAGKIADVIAEVQDQLQANRRPAVYFIYDHYSDGPQVSSLAKLLPLKTGCDVFLSQVGEKYHNFRLQMSDGVLLFRNEAPEDWFKSQKDSLLQAAARRARRDVAEAWYITHRPNGHPSGVHAIQGSRREWIIERTGEPNVDDLQPFFDALQTSVKAVEGRIA
jgi:TIR domain-containing protein